MTVSCSKKFIQESISGSCFSAVTESGELFVCGDNQNGQLGLGDTTNRTYPEEVKMINSTWEQCAISDKHSLAIKSDGTLWSCGNNSFGQLGLGDTTNRLSHTQVGTGTNWVSVEASAYGINGGFSLAIKSDGTLWSWGNNSFGQLGLGDTTNRTSPTQVGTGTNWVSVEAGVWHSLAIKSDGTLWSWGSNPYGQLGLGDTTNRTSPTQVGTGTNWAILGKILASSSLAIKSDGTLWLWGYNGFGQLGLGDTTKRTSPTQVGTETNWVSGSIGIEHSLSVKSDGTLWSWGANSYGQFGDGTTTSSSLPKMIMTSSPIESVYCGEYFSLIIAKQHN